VNAIAYSWCVDYYIMKKIKSICMQIATLKKIHILNISYKRSEEMVVVPRYLSILCGRIYNVHPHLLQVDLHAHLDWEESEFCSSQPPPG
jgi:hypothetical protein